MTSMNHRVAVGNLCGEPELRFTGSGQAVTNLRVAVNERWTRNGETHERTIFENVVVWDIQATNVAQSLTKGDRVIVIGRNQQRELPATEQYPARTITEIVADHVGPSLQWAAIDGDLVRSTRKEPAMVGAQAESGDPLYGDEEPF